jgi:hypothetical protein
VHIWPGLQALISGKNPFDPTSDARPGSGARSQNRDRPLYRVPCASDAPRCAASDLLRSDSSYRRVPSIGHKQRRLGCLGIQKSFDKYRTRKLGLCLKLSGTRLRGARRRNARNELIELTSGSTRVWRQRVWVGAPQPALDQDARLKGVGRMGPRRLWQHAWCLADLKHH